MAAEGSVGSIPAAASFAVGNCMEVGKHDDANSEISYSTIGILIVFHVVLRHRCMFFLSLRSH